MLHRIPDSDNSLEIIQPFVRDLGDSRDVQIMGGVGTAALSDPRTEICTYSKEVIAPHDFFLPAFRNDGTLRDVDVLVLSSDVLRTSEVDNVLMDTVGSRLERSVFGIRPREVLQRQLAHPLGFRAFRTFLSDRYEAGSVDGEAYVKSLFPFAVPFDPEALETWTLVVGDDSHRIPIPHPGMTLANYCNRSISGLRPRDEDKIASVAANVFRAAPEIKEWLMNGPGKTQLELGALIASLRHPGLPSMELFNGVTVRTYTPDELVEHPAFMLPEYSSGYCRSVLGLAALKATLLHSFENNPRVVTAWRQVAERHADLIVKNA